MNQLSKMIYSIIFSISICLVAIYTPGFNNFLAFAPLHLSDWISIFIASAIFLLVHELIKVFKNMKLLTSRGYKYK